MSKAKQSLLSASLGLFVLAGALFGLNRWASSPDLNSFPPEKVMTYDCESVTQKPSELFEFCADGNGGIAKIKWDTWASDSATGVGVYFRNNCEPNCASGKVSYTNVALTLENPVVTKGKVFLTSVAYE